MSALFSHAVRWEFCGQQPDLLRHSGRKWRKEGANYGSSCQFQTPQVAVEMDGRASGAGSDRARIPRSASRVPGCRTGNTSRRTRRTPLDGLRFSTTGPSTSNIPITDYWRREGTSSIPSRRLRLSRCRCTRASKMAFWEWRSQSLYNQPEDFVLRFGKAQGSQATRSSRRVEKERYSPRSRGLALPAWAGIRFRHTVGTMLAEMGEHQLTIRDYLRHSNLHVTNKYLQATSKTKRLAHDKLVDAFCLPACYPKTNLVQ